MFDATDECWEGGSTNLWCSVQMSVGKYPGYRQNVFFLYELIIISPSKGNNKLFKTRRTVSLFPYYFQFLWGFRPKF